MNRPRLLDGCCCAGGATKGYQVAGFHVTGVDVSPQPNYCGDEFVQGDDRYLPRGGVRHRTRPNFLEPSTLVAACGVSANEAYWRGTGSQDEYEYLSSIPRCTRCLAAESSS